ncbi:MAG: hypothetical protein ACRCUY_02925 [Thermoguttaceae bacterium]
MGILFGEWKPRSIALGIAFGVLLGLLPKLNLLFLVSTLFLLFSFASIPIAAGVAALVSICSFAISPVADKIGGTILVSPLGQQLGGFLHRIPGFPWLFLDNTVVLGFFLIGLFCFIPIFLATWIFAALVLPRPTQINSNSDAPDN